MASRIPLSALIRFQSTPLHKGRRCWRLSPAMKLLSFNPRPCIRGDFYGYTLGLSFPWFQSTPLHKGRPMATNHARNFGLFQSTPLHKGRPYQPLTNRLVNTFQSTPLHKGRRAQFRGVLIDSRFQSTPLHKGRRPDAGDFLHF